MFLARSEPVLRCYAEHCRLKRIERGDLPNRGSAIGDLVFRACVTKRRRRWLRQCTNIHGPSGRLMFGEPIITIIALALQEPSAEAL